MFIGQTEEPCGIVVEDVALLFLSEEVGACNRVDRDFDGLRSHHLVAAEHYSLGVTGIGKAL